ncbi:MAG: deaminase [Bacteroidales bacterium]|jgi:dCMP deaminase|nr:deaminase [Bacteroidales bacterium]
MLVIGITGSIGAGKGSIVNVLKKSGFVHFSAREFLVEKIKELGLDVNRDTMTLVANRLRSDQGNDFIARGLLEKAKKENNNCVIESIRNVKEIDYLKENTQFILFSIDADIKTRYKRIKARKSETDNVDFKTFVANDQREMDSKDENKQNIRSCMERADFTFLNNGTMEDLDEEVKKVLAIIQHKERPSWDKYFLEIVSVVAKRATCNRGRSGCVIVKDKQILVTGYVGSPNGLPHCDEVGHLFKKMIDDDGNVSNHCVRTVHAEQNAICQAAKRGIALDGATLYCTMTPCRTCAMMIINCGIKRVVCQNKYHSGSETEQLFKDSKIVLDFVCNDVLKYDNQ